MDVTAESYLHYNKGIFTKWFPIYKVLNSVPGVMYLAFPGGSVKKNPPGRCSETQETQIPTNVEDPERNWQPTPVLLLETPMGRGACRLQSVGLQRVGLSIQA